MTKVRPPVTIENTLFRVLGELGIERAAEVTGRSTHYLLALTDPEKREQLSIRDALALDLACRDAGDATFPLYETFGLMLEAANATHIADAVAIGRHAAEFAVESGEATAAMIAVAVDSTNLGAIEHALREMEQAHDASTDAIATLRARRDAARGAAQPP